MEERLDDKTGLPYPQRQQSPVRLVSAPKCLEELSKEALSAKLQRGYDQMLRGEVIPLEDAEDVLRHRAFILAAEERRLEGAPVFTLEEMQARSEAIVDSYET